MALVDITGTGAIYAEVGSVLAIARWNNGTSIYLRDHPEKVVVNGDFDEILAHYSQLLEEEEDEYISDDLEEVNDELFAGHFLNKLEELSEGKEIEGFDLGSLGFNIDKEEEDDSDNNRGT
jgi:hypothetical protein